MRTLVSLIAICSLVSLGFAQDVGWPREKINQTGTIVYYQPQLSTTGKTTVN